MVSFNVSLFVTSDRGEYSTYASSSLVGFDPDSKDFNYNCKDHISLTAY